MSKFLIPDGRYLLTAAMDDRVRHMARAPDRAGERAHPIFAFVAALGGLGLKIADLSAALGLAFERGPVLARCRLSYDAPLLVDRSYDVRAEIDDLQRKPSRVFGAADHLHLSIRLRDERPYSRARLHIVYPAGEA
ncbi:hypothetical protein [Sinisalibacter aestuarii]|uniref:MaoC-like domain-containing protein n=1 Tax=Sinisalibacter aestuarii TaxID=2949426 RepID=A0ABQ5LZ88_9RHOB|nr:hypothetical protein [Sinisalibacter aestuarii]GKY89576.1 hypothetical protein STA1M1_34450 [Sinisalibacter aestuarii]